MTTLRHTALVDAMAHAIELGRALADGDRAYRAGDYNALIGAHARVIHHHDQSMAAAAVIQRGDR